jgi:hypothetical protein
VFLRRYVLNRSSKNRSGSNSSATQIIYRQQSDYSHVGEDTPSGPQRSFRLCMMNIEYGSLQGRIGLVEVDGGRKTEETRTWSQQGCRVVSHSDRGTARRLLRHSLCVSDSVQHSILTISL